MIGNLIHFFTKFVNFCNNSFKNPKVFTKTADNNNVR